MRIAITFRYQSKHKGRNNECGYAYLGRGEAESLPHFIEFETPALANHKRIRNTKNHHIPSFGAKRRISDDIWINPPTEMTRDVFASLNMTAIAFSAAEPEPNESVV